MVTDTVYFVKSQIPKKGPNKIESSLKSNDYTQ